MLARCSHASWLAPLVAVAVAGLVSPMQDPAQSAPAAPLRVPALSLQEERKAEAAKQMLGAWMLERFEHPTELVPPENVRGCAMSTDGYLMIEMHARRPSRVPVGNQWVMLYQSGLYQYVFEDDKRITCSTILGHSNFSGDMEYEVPGTPRQFDLEVGAYSMVLTRPDGARLLFKRLPPNPQLSDETLKKMEALRAQRGGR
jgi:hypothetical protein